MDELKFRLCVEKQRLHPNPSGATDLARYKRWVRQWRAAFPDFHVEVHDLIAEGDKVGAR